MKYVQMLMFFLLILGCSTKKYEIHEVNGIKTIENFEMPIQQFSLEKDFVISDETKEYIISNVRDIAGDKEGNLYVLDGKECDVKVFDSTGQYIRSFSRKGKGPGELYSPGSIYINDSNEILIKEMTRAKMIVFSIDGEFKTDYKMGRFFNYDLCTYSDSSYICTGRFFAQEVNSNNALHILTRELEVLKSFHEIPDAAAKISIEKHKDTFILSSNIDNDITIMKNFEPQIKIKRHLYKEGKIIRMGHGVLSYPSSTNLKVDSKGNIYTIALTDNSDENKEKKDSIPDHILQVFNKKGIQIVNMALDDSITDILLVDDYIYAYHYSSGVITRYKPLSLT